MNETHDTFTRQLSDYLDGELDPRARAAVSDHLSECADCRRVLHELRAIVETAGRLPGTLPERDLWEGVEGRIDPRAAPGTLLDRASKRRFAFTLPQLAAAALALMVMSGGLVYMALPAESPAEPSVRRGGEVAISPVSLADPQYENAIGDLERTLADGRQHLDPETVRVLEQNLETIDRAIAQAREALESDPGNVFLNSHIVAARQRKLALLRRATALTTGS